MYEKAASAQFRGAKVTHYPIWHGTTIPMFEKIMKNGFKREYAHKNGKLLPKKKFLENNIFSDNILTAIEFGEGVYFSKKASFFLEGKIARPDENNNHRLLLCSLVTGSYCKGDTKMKQAPIDPKAGRPYHTTVDKVKDPSIHVAFHPFAANPHYLLEIRYIS